MRFNKRTRYTLKKDHLKRLELPEFDPNNLDYTNFELEAYTELLLREDKTSNPEFHKGKNNQYPHLSQEQMEQSRWPREVNSTTGDVDEAITKASSPDGQRMYNRTHPRGRTVNSKDQRRRNGASFIGK